MARILIAYATKYGATAEIAAKIGDVLRGAGFATDVCPVPSADTPSAYDAVVLGSAVYAAKWRKEAARYLTGNEKALSERPVWLFSSGPTGQGDAVDIMKGWQFPEDLQPVADGVQPRDIALFHGVIDLRKLNFIERMMMKAMKAPTGDYRDWDAITAWATAIATTLRTD
jgi:menaquinone-dependent protoporphyrinogen oxidase